jgi:hypothetical protein
MIIVRYADDFIIGFEYENDARAIGEICVVATSREDPTDRV